jgi:hypothetical protein
VAAFDSRGCLFSDGEKLAVGFEAYDRMFLLNSYYVQGLSMHHDYVDINVLGGFREQVTTRQRVEFTVSSIGRVSDVPFKEGIKLFRGADDLSVNELLALAFQKMEDRQPDNHA